MTQLSICLEPTTLKTATVHLSGALVESTVDQLESCVETIEPGCVMVVLDLHLVTALDAVAIVALDRLHRTFDATARCLQLRNVVGPLRRELDNRRRGEHFVLQ